MESESTPTLHARVVVHQLNWGGSERPSLKVPFNAVMYAIPMGGAGAMKPKPYSGPGYPILQPLPVLSIHHLRVCKPLCPGAQATSVHRAMLELQAHAPRCLSKIGKGSPQNPGARNVCELQVPVLGCSGLYFNCSAPLLKTALELLASSYALALGYIVCVPKIGLHFLDPLINIIFP